MNFDFLDSTIYLTCPSSNENAPKYLPAKYCYFWQTLEKLKKPEET